jgi:AcrR family transcriptional regulator
LEFVDRTGILEAMATAMAERSTGAVTVAEVAARAGVSGAAFSALFADREACLLAAFDLGVQRASSSVIPAFEAEANWLDAIKVALASFLRFLEREPELGSLIVFYSLSGGAEVQLRRRQVLSVLAEVVDRGAERIEPGRHRPPPLIAEGVVGAVLTIIQNRMLAEGQESLLTLFGELVSIIVLPYLGSTVARRELARPAPRARLEGESSAAYAAARGSSIRLTYRTARVLRAIGHYPGASNREVAERAGIVDQGQVSKLLSRLEIRGLIANIDGERTRGAPNSWQLTERGGIVLGDEPASR